MPIAGQFFVTPHAVKRYVRRVCPGLSYGRALAEIVRAVERAHRVKGLPGGAELWRGPRPDRLRIFVAPARAPGLAPVVVTVMRGCDRGA